MEKLKIVILFLLIAIVTTFIYVLSGLYLSFEIREEAFSLLSIELVLFAFLQAIYEINLKNAIIYFAISYSIGLFFEILGVNYGFPFGNYSYSQLLGPEIFGVPVAVPFVWFFITYLAFSVTKKSSLSIPRLLLASLGAMNWDIFIDPMFVSYGYWSWINKDYIPSLYSVPVTNFIGWYFVSLFILIVFYYTRKKSVINNVKNNNLFSYLVYLALLVDGILANLYLEHYLVIYIGAILGIIFLTTSSLKYKSIIFKKL